MSGRRRAVIIEDDKTVATILTDIVTLHGVDVVAVAHDYDTGTALLVDDPAFDLAFIDLRLGDALNGAQLARQAVERGIQVIVVTGSSGLPEDLAAAALLTKPFSVEAVRLVLDTLGGR